MLPVADDKVCVSCYNPVVVSCYDQHLPGINNRTCTYTNMPLLTQLLLRSRSLTLILSRDGGHWETRLACQIMLTAALTHAHMHTNEITHTHTHTFSKYVQAECEHSTGVFILCCCNALLCAFYFIYILIWTRILTHPVCCPLFQVGLRGTAEEEEEDLHE